MSLLESVDIQAREDIEKLKEQYTQSGLERLTEFEEKLGRRFGDLERKFTECDAKHEAHNSQRRKSDTEMSHIAATLQETLTVHRQTQATMSQLLLTVEKHTPTVERSSKTHTTFDGLKSFMIYAACVSACILAIQHILEVFLR